MEEKEVRESIEEALCDHCEDTIQDASSFEDNGVLTNNEGLVLKFIDGSMFQVTIVKTN